MLEGLKKFFDTDAANGLGGEIVIPSKPKYKRVIPKREILRIFQRLAYEHDPHTVWSDLVMTTACALANRFDKANYDKREAEYIRTIGRYAKDEQRLFPEFLAMTVTALEENPDQDFLGDIFQTLGLANYAKGQFFTPYNVCRLTASLTLGDIAKHVEEKGYISISDPCCGAGATLIAGVNEARRQLTNVGLNFQNHVLVVGQDIDPTAALMCYIQLSLLGVAGYVKIGNALTEPIAEGGSMERYWFTPMYFSYVWATRILLGALKEAWDDERV